MVTVVGDNPLDHWMVEVVCFEWNTVIVDFLFLVFMFISIILYYYFTGTLSKVGLCPIDNPLRIIIDTL